MTDDDTPVKVGIEVLITRDGHVAQIGDASVFCGGGGYHARGERLRVK
jgi:hypothetical protein